MRNAEFSPFRGLGADTFWLPFVVKKGAVRAAMIDTDALIKMIAQDSPIYALALVAFVETLIIRYLNRGLE